jgi:hypothetical protein
MCASDIDSLSQMPSNEISNSFNRRSSLGQVQPLVTISFSIRVLTKSLLRPNFRNFTSKAAPKPPICFSDIDSPHQMPSNEMSNSTNRRSILGEVWPLVPISFSIHVLAKSLHRPNYRNFTSRAAPKPPCVLVISIPLIKCRRMRCLTPSIGEIHRAIAPT